MRTSDPDCAARLRPADMMLDGIGMVAETIGAYTINVPGRGVQPRQGKLLAETFRRRAGDAQALILNRTTSTSRVPSSSVRRSTHNCLHVPSHFAVPSKMGRLLREMGRHSCEARRRSSKRRVMSAGTALESYNFYLSGSLPATVQL